MLDALLLFGWALFIYNFISPEDVIWGVAGWCFSEFVLGLWNVIRERRNERMRNERLD